MISHDVISLRCHVTKRTYWKQLQLGRTWCRIKLAHGIMVTNSCISECCSDLKLVTTLPHKNYHMIAKVDCTITWVTCMHTSSVGDSIPAYCPLEPEVSHIICNILHILYRVRCCNFGSQGILSCFNGKSSFAILKYNVSKQNHALCMLRQWLVTTYLAAILLLCADLSHFQSWYVTYIHQTLDFSFFWAETKSSAKTTQIRILQLSWKQKHIGSRLVLRGPKLWIWLGKVFQDRNSTGNNICELQSSGILNW